MFGDAYATAAFSGQKAAVFAVVLLAGAVTAGLYALGLPLSWCGVVFAVLFVGSMVIARPLFARCRPRFESTGRR